MDDGSIRDRLRLSGTLDGEVIIDKDVSPDKMSVGILSQVCEFRILRQGGVGENVDRLRQVRSDLGLVQKVVPIHMRLDVNRVDGMEEYVGVDDMVLSARNQDGSLPFASDPVEKIFTHEQSASTRKAFDGRIVPVGRSDVAEEILLDLVSPE